MHLPRFGFSMKVHTISVAMLIRSDNGVSTCSLFGHQVSCNQLYVYTTRMPAPNECEVVSHSWVRGVDGEIFHH